MIKNIFSQLVATGINQVLALDPSQQDFLSRFNGKVIQLQISELNSSFFVIIRQDKIFLYSLYSDKPDTSIRGSIFSFIKQLLPTGEKNTLEIEGDVELAQQMQLLIKNLDIEWEEYLSYLIGDTFADGLGGLWRQLKNSTVSATKRNTENLVEYIQEEKRFLPTREEVEDFYDDVSQLRHHIDRLEAHLNRIMEK